MSLAAAPALSIGLTGGIGSGKSTVAAELVACGAVLIDTDAIAHALTGPNGAAMPALRVAFGDAIATAQGALDRARMRELVFDQPQAKARLEAVLHPMIGAEAQRQVQQAGNRPIVFDVPLMTASSPWRRRVQRLLVIDCAEQTQIQRVMQRSGWSAEQVRRVMAQQLSRGARRALADAVIFNDSLSRSELSLQVRTLWRWWQGAP